MQSFVTDLSKGGVLHETLWITPLLAAAPQAGCGGREAPISPGEAPETSLAERDALSLYAAAAAGILDDGRTALALPSPAEAGNLRIQRPHYAMIREIDAAMQRVTSHTTGDTGLTSPLFRNIRPDPLDFSESGLAFSVFLCYKC